MPILFVVDANGTIRLDKNGALSERAGAHAHTYIINTFVIEYTSLRSDGKAIRHNRNGTIEIYR